MRTIPLYVIDVWQQNRVYSIVAPADQTLLEAVKNFTYTTFGYLNFPLEIYDSSGCVISSKQVSGFFGEPIYVGARRIECGGGDHHQMP